MHARRSNCCGEPFCFGLLRLACDSLAHYRADCIILCHGSQISPRSGLFSLPTSDTVLGCTTTYTSQKAFCKRDSPLEAMGQRKGPDTLDKTVTYLAKRDGIDKVLKVIRYSTKLALATAFKNDSSDLALRLKEFESSIGTSRKAYRLGKWLSDLNTLRNTPVLTKAGSLELLASGGEGVYYFVEQLTWLVKAGLLDKKYAKRFSTISAWAELIGYFGNVTLNALRIAAALERELMLTQELVRRKKEDEAMPDDVHLIREVQALRSRRLIRTLAVVQDFSDALMAINDITDGKGPVNSTAVLSMCGLLSAFISVHKNWPSS